MQLMPNNASYIYPLYFNSVILGFDGETGYIDGLGEKVTRSNRLLSVGGSCAALLCWYWPA